MNDVPPQPHDHLFRTVFSDPEDATGLLQAYLPARVVRSLRWSTLAVQDGRFVDERLRERESDLLFAVERETGSAMWLYVLLEHQSTPDRWMRLRLLTYCCRVWDRDRQRRASDATLRPILPVVFFQGRQGWPHPTGFTTLFPEEDRRWPWGPQFEHILIDQAAIGPEEVRGTLRGRIAQLTMMAAQRDSWAATRGALRLLAELNAAAAPDDIDPLLPYVVYLHATLPRGHWRRFADALRREVPAGGTAMDYAEQLVQQGIQKGIERGVQQGIEQGVQQGIEQGVQQGIRQGQAKVVDDLLRAGVPWSTIEAATGIDPDTLRALKRASANTDAAPDGAEDTDAAR